MTMLPLLAALVLAISQAKKPVPDPDALKEADKLVKEVFKDELAKKAPADRIELARKFLSQALQTDDDPASRFVLLREARDGARDAGDWETALKALDEMGRRFEVDACSPKLAIYQAMAKAAKTPEDFNGIARRMIALVDESILADQLDTGAKAATEASATARKAKDIPLAAKADAKSRDVGDRRAARDKLARAMETLAKSPGDPEANVIVGRQEGFLKGDWAKALPRLAKASDPALKAAAERDLANPATPEARIAAGDGWWDLAEKETGPARANLRKRAAYWYQQAPGGTGLVRVKLDKRLGEVHADQFPGTWVNMTDARLFGLPGKAGEPIPLAGEDDGRRIIVEKALPGDFDALTGRLRFGSSTNAIGTISFEQLDHAITVSRTHHSAALLHVADGKLKAHQPVAVADKEEYTVTVILTGGEYIGYVDGVEIGRLATKYTKMVKLSLQVESGNVMLDQFMLRKKE